MAVQYYYDLVSPSVSPSRLPPFVTPASSPSRTNDIEDRDTPPAWEEEELFSTPPWTPRTEQSWITTTPPLTPTLRSPRETLPRTLVFQHEPEDEAREESPPRSPRVTFPVYLDPRERPSHLFTTPPLPPPRPSKMVK